MDSLKYFFAGLALMTSVTGFASSKVAAEGSKKLILTFQQSTPSGLFQTSFVVSQGNQIDWRQNSNAFLPELPIALGWFRQNSKELALKITELGQSFKIVKTTAADHGLQILWNGDPIDTASPQATAALELLKELAAQPRWKPIHGQWINAADLNRANCDFAMEFCRFEQGVIIVATTAPTAGKAPHE